MKTKKENYFKKFFKYASEYKFLIALITIFSVLESFVGIISPKIFGDIITSLFADAVPGQPFANYDYIFKSVYMLTAVYLLFASCKSLEKYFSNYVIEKISYKLREDISKKINKLSLGYIEETSYGDIMSRTFNDTEAISFALTSFLGDTLSSVFMGAGVIYMMFSISWEMSLLSFLSFPVIGFVIFLSAFKSKKYYKEYRESIGKINSCTEESFSGYETLKSFGAEKSFEEKFNKISGSIYKCEWKTDFYSSFIAPVMGFVGNFNSIISCVLGGYFVVLRGFSVGNISAFIAYSANLNDPLITIGSLANSWQNISAASERIFNILNAPEEETVESLGSVDLNSDVAVEFKNVKFEYKENTPVIEDLSLKIKKGDTVAIVGETGAGKTTLVNLLLKFYTPNGGSIDFMGQNIRKINNFEYRKHFGIVTQDCWLYKDTIMENIRYGNLKASDKEVKKVAKFIGVDHFIESLPDGYETIVEEGGANISEGQKQLLCIARLVLSNSDVLILDEATAAIDTHTEIQIQNVLKFVLEGKTSIIIAHRLSTIKNADVIVVMDKGKIAEMGKHNELINKNGLYSELYKSQFKNV
ncbi:MAG: ABC transporter ATP-binding protein [Clostridia bacterium]|nr:ABC transporter ATP-binding protein [Clostridia bacterium]